MPHYKGGQKVNSRGRFHESSTEGRSSQGGPAGSAGACQRHQTDSRSTEEVATRHHQQENAGLRSRCRAHHHWRDPCGELVARRAGGHRRAVLFGKSGFWLAAMAGALAMATCELVRAGLVYLGAVHRRRAVRGLMLFGALLSVLVTTKSMSIVYEQLFASRLREVVAATMALDKAQADKATLEAKRKGPAADDADRKARLARFDSELAGLRDTLKQFGTPPKPVTKLVPTYDRHGQVTGQRLVTTTPPWSGATMQSQYRQGSSRARQAGCGACAWPVRSSRPRDPDRAGGRSRDGGKQPANGKGCGEPDAFLRGDDLSQVTP